MSTLLLNFTAKYISAKIEHLPLFEKVVTKFWWLRVGLHYFD